MIDHLQSLEPYFSHVLGITNSMAFAIVSGTSFIIWYRVYLLRLGIKHPNTLSKVARLAPLDVKILLNCLSFVLAGFSLRYFLICIIRLNDVTLHTVLFYEIPALVADSLVIVSSLYGIRSVTYSVCGNRGVGFFFVLALFSALFMWTLE